MNSQKEAYKIEAYELLSELETSLLELEQRSDDLDLVDRVFRSMHTIKGSGAMFGFDAIAEFTHEVETAFDLVRDGRINVSTHLVNLALRARDHIKTMLDGDENPDAVNGDEGRTLVESFRAIIAEHQSDPIEELPSEDIGYNPSIFETNSEESIYRIGLAPHPTLFKNGSNPLGLLNEIAELGECRSVVYTDGLPAPETFDPEQCYLKWEIFLITRCDKDAIRDIFIFVEDVCDLSVELVNTMDEILKHPGYKQLGKILVERGDLDPDNLNFALQKQRRLGEILIEEQQIRPERIHSALAEQELLRKTGTQRALAASRSSLRVAADKLDVLVNLVGELVTVQARLSQKAGRENDPELIAITEVVERLTDELRDNTLSIRMVPIDSTFTNLRRLIRDLSKDLGKQIELRTEGGDTELDKTVIEQLNDPLMHILRNSIDHGIELPEQRRAAGKPEQGTITLKAEHSGANVLIHIHDDGAGIDAEKIRAKAREKGLIAHDSEKSDKESLQLIFHPGFSTADCVTNVSGRGVGMDVVKRSIEGLRGAVDVSSRNNQGTTITMKLPLTLAIIDGLLVEIQANKYVLPLAAIEECVELTREDMARTRGRNILQIRGQIVPFVSLRQHFGIMGTAPDIEQVVINEVAGQRVGIVVDRVIGEHQIVIKTMNSLYKEVQEISGATILGDGTVALILDVQKLINNIETTALAA